MAIKITGLSLVFFFLLWLIKSGSRGCVVLTSLSKAAQYILCSCQYMQKNRSNSWNSYRSWNILQLEGIQPAGKKNDSSDLLELPDINVWRHDSNCFSPDGMLAAGDLISIFKKKKKNFQNCHWQTASNPASWVRFFSGPNELEEVTLGAASSNLSSCAWCFDKLVVRKK